MDEAPLDGTPVLLFGGAPDRYSDQSHGDMEHPRPCVVAWCDEHGEWRFASYDGGEYGIWQDPHFWTPLPAGPAPLLHDLESRLWNA